MNDQIYYVYILAQHRRGFIYHGLTSGLAKRVWEHKHEVVEGHTKKYKIKKLVYFESHDNYEEAAKREKQLKRWRRKWKEELIEKDNPEWNDLYEKIANG